jgi:hypothetical protein
LHCRSIMRSSREVRASDGKCQSRNSPVAKFIVPDGGDKVDSGQLYFPCRDYEFGYSVQSQHPSTQLNLRGGRWSSVV